MRVIENYTWAQFKAVVSKMLGVNASRSGTTDLRESWIRQAVIHLQSNIDAYRLGHEAIYGPQDMIVEGCASRGVKPPQSVIRDVYLCRLVDDGAGGKTCVRYPTENFEWKDRFGLIHGSANLNGRGALFTIDPQGYNFLVYPELFDCWVLSIFWEGLKLDFKDDEETPFDEQMAGAVAEFVEAQYARKVSTDLALHDSHMRSFMGMQPRLYVAAKEKSELRWSGGQPGSRGVNYCSPSMDPFCNDGNTTTVVRTKQQVFTYPGDPNGYVTADCSPQFPAICLDTVNKITWWKDDGVFGNTGWH